MTENVPWSNKIITVSITKWKHSNIFSWGSTSIQVRVMKAEEEINQRGEAK
jgi:hypothetical protein